MDIVPSGPGSVIPLLHDMTQCRAGPYTGIQSTISTIGPDAAYEQKFIPHNFILEGSIVVACKLGPKENALYRRFGAPNVSLVKRKTERWQDLGAFVTRFEETRDWTEEKRHPGVQCSPSLKAYFTKLNWA